MKRYFIVLGIVALIFCGSSCASSGQKIHQKNLADIHGGGQSKEEIVAMFGAPSFQRPQGKEFYYMQVFIPVSWTLKSRPNSALLSGVSEKANGCCEQWVYRYEAKKGFGDAGHRETLVISFDQNDNVVSYKFDTNFAVTSERVKELRARTGAPPLECKHVLSEMNGDMDKSVEELHSRGIATARSRY